MLIPKKRAVLHLVLFSFIFASICFGHEIYSLNASVDKQTGQVTLNWNTSLEIGYFEKYIYDEFDGLNSRWITRSVYVSESLSSLITSETSNIR